MIILVINCGSSSIKYQLLDMKSDDVYDLMAKGVVEKIGLPDGILTHKPTGKTPLVKNLPIPDHKVGMELLLAALVDPESGVLKSFDDIEAVGHRIVQGADFFSGSALVDELLDLLTARVEGRPRFPSLLRGDGAHFPRKSRKEPVAAEKFDTHRLDIRRGGGGGALFRRTFDGGIDFFDHRIHCIIPS